MTVEYLPRLRPGIDIIPSPVAESPGLILRDPFHYTPSILLVPYGWAPALALLDGKQTELDMQAFLTRRNGGQLVPLEDIRKFVNTLSSHGFLDSEKFHQLRESVHEQFRQAPERRPKHAGSAYPSDAGELGRQLREDFRILPPDTNSIQDHLIGIAAPHVSPFGGVESYGAAYRQLAHGLKERTFVILGTSHYGMPEKFGLTRKPYVTPFGKTEVDISLLERLARKAPDAVIMEDYCHAIEHSIEFQVVFLQHVLGPNIRILPILCGPLFEGFRTGRHPDTHPNVAQFIAALADLLTLKRDELFWVLGVDMAHIGVRYGDGIAVTAGEGRMREVSARDHERLEHVCAGNTEDFVGLVQQGQDELKWCGYSPFYVFMRAMERAESSIRGRLLRYDQWNIDSQSVVSFGALEFFNRT